MCRLLYLGIVFKLFHPDFVFFPTIYDGILEAIYPKKESIMIRKTRKQRQARKQTRKQTQKVPSYTNLPTYTEAEYNSNDGMLTTVWGPAMWHYLHTMSFNYPAKPSAKDKKHYHEFVIKLQHVLPCGKCRENLKSNFKKLPIKKCAMKSRYTFSKYIYDLHELINTMLGKQSGLTYEKVRERYEHFRSRCGKTRTRKKREKGCTEPIVGTKSKCVINIVPKSEKVETFNMDKRCEKIRTTANL